jgi:hypothetical protein
MIPLTWPFLYFFFLACTFYELSDSDPLPPEALDQPAGYDNNGQPYFLPRGCMIPTPAGYTSDGIPFYDITSVMQQQGRMVLRSEEKRNYYLRRLGMLSDDDASSVGRSFFDNLVEADERPRLFRKGEKDLQIGLLDSVKALERAQPGFGDHLQKASSLHSSKVGLQRLHERIKRHSSTFGDFIPPERRLMTPITEQEPGNAMESFSAFRESEDFAMFKPNPMKVTLEPSVLEFQSVRLNAVRTLLLKYRSPRGDYLERDFFLSIEPLDTFSAKLTHFRLQGEGSHEIPITFFPSTITGERVDGFINLIDGTGKKLASCYVIGIKKSFIRLSGSVIDFGWSLPASQKAATLRIENVSSAQVPVSFEIVARKPNQGRNSGGETKDVPGFVLTASNIKLRLGETKFAPISFSPKEVGDFSGILKVFAPGGEMLRIPIHGVAGVPLALYAESAEESKIGSAVLTKERSEFMQKYWQAKAFAKDSIMMSALESQIVHSIANAAKDPEIFSKSPTVLDFGICDQNFAKVTRCLTIMNMSDATITLGTFCNLPAFISPPRFRIAANGAHTMEIMFSGVDSNFRGTVAGFMEVICPELPT